MRQGPHLIAKGNGEKPWVLSLQVSSGKATRDENSTLFLAWQ